MVHKFCIGLKRLPGINEKWFCDWCHWYLSTQKHFKRIELTHIQDLYSRNPDVSLQRLKQETIAKNEQIHLAMIRERKSSDKRDELNIVSLSMFTENSSSDQQSGLDVGKLPKNTLNSKITKQSKKRQRVNSKNVTTNRRVKRESSKPDSHPLNTRDTYHSADSVSNNGHDFDLSTEPFKIDPNSSETKCLFCRRTGTPMLRINDQTKFWGHLSCAYWLQEASVDLTARQIMISDKVLKFASQQKNGHVCGYCPQKGGLVTRCHEDSCHNMFHVECGRLIHCEMKLPYHLNSKQKDHIMFCHEHSKSETLRKIESARGIDKVPLRNFVKQFQESHRFMRLNLHRTATRQVKRIFKKQKLVVFLKKTTKSRKTTYSYRYSKLV